MKRKFDLRQCSLCPLGHNKANIVLGEKHFVRGRSRIFFLGEAPGHDEDQIGKPFVGRAGRLLRNCMQNAGINSYYISNVCFCRPPDNRAPTEIEMMICGHYTLLELTVTQPHLVVALGKTATDFLKTFHVAKPSYSELRTKKAWSIHIPTTGQQVIIKSIFHPAYLLRNKGLIQAYRNEFRKIGLLAKQILESET